MTNILYVHHNHPPMVAGVFNHEYLQAQEQAFAVASPADAVRTHRWMGTDSDRAAGARFAAARLGTMPEPGRVVVTNGTQSALLMLTAGLVGKGGILVTENLTYPPLVTFANHFGYRIVGAPIDEHGLIPDRLREIVHAARPNALYIVPTYQNPTTSIMPDARRREIATIAREYGLPIIEDDIYSLMKPDLPPPVSAYAPELSWYLLGTAKSIAAGLKVAYVVAPTAEEAEKRFWPGVRGTHWMATPMSAAIASELIASGGAERIIAAVSNEVDHRQKLVGEAFREIDHVTRPGALHVWFELPAGMQRQALVTQTERNGLIIGASDQYVVDAGPVPEAVRIGIGNPRTQDDLSAVLDRFLQSYRQVRDGHATAAA